MLWVLWFGRGATKPLPKDVDFSTYPLLSVLILLTACLNVLPALWDWEESSDVFLSVRFSGISARKRLGV